MVVIGGGCIVFFDVCVWLFKLFYVGINGWLLFRHLIVLSFHLPSPEIPHILDLNFFRYGPRTTTVRETDAPRARSTVSNVMLVPSGGIEPVCTTTKSN